ncbi:MAG: MFS transporter [Rikenellaceae bacterium]
MSQRFESIEDAVAIEVVEDAVFAADALDDVSEDGSHWDGLQMPRMLFAILAVMLAIALSVIDGVIVNIALPTICSALSITASESIWVVNIYQISIITSLLPLSAMGDVVGYRRLFRIGLIIFILMSVGCALSWSFGALLFFRAAQGFGASCLMSIGTSLVRLIYPRRMLGRGLGINSTVVSVSSVAGPTIAASILALGDWRWLFAINIPIGVAAIIMGWLFLPANPIKLKSMSDYRWRDALLNLLAFASTFAFFTSFSHNLDWWILIVEGAVAVVVGYIYVKSQLNSPLPILPFDLLKIPIFSLSVVTSILSFVAQMATMVAMPFILQHQFGYTPIEVGVVLTAWPAVNMIATPISGFLVERSNPGLLGMVGLVILTIGMSLLIFIPDEPTKSDLIWRLTICGLGFGIFQSPNNSLIIASAPLARSGSASGMMATARLAGQTLGASLVALLFYMIPKESMVSILSVGFIFSALAMILSFTRLSLPTPEALIRR